MPVQGFRFDVAERFWEKATIPQDAEAACWEWSGARTKQGYGQFWRDRAVHAHRVAYELAKGPIPTGLTIDHLCRNRACVNPAHLEAVTAAENTLRGFSPPANHSRKTHCVRGHEFNSQNTRFRIAKNGRPRRECRLCEAENKERRIAQMRAEMQRHADEIRTLVAVFREEPVSSSSVEWLTARLEGLADRMSPLAPAPPVKPRRRLRAVR